MDSAEWCTHSSDSCKLHTRAAVWRVFLSWISRHHVRALPENTLLSPTKRDTGKLRLAVRHIPEPGGAEFRLQVLFNEDPNQKVVWTDLNLDLLKTRLASLRHPFALVFSILLSHSSFLSVSSLPFPLVWQLLAWTGFTKHVIPSHRM